MGNGAANLAARVWHGFSDRAQFRRLEEHPQGPRLAAALRHAIPADEIGAIGRIEHERARLKACNDLLLDDSTMTVSTACRASKAPRSARLLYQLVRALRPQTVLELGTNVGISSAYMAAAVRANGGGKVVTLDGSRGRQAIARDVHARLGLDSLISYSLGWFDDTLDDVLRQHGPIDFAYIDGNHQLEPTLRYFRTIAAAARPDAVFVFDDIRWSDGMREAWSTLLGDARLGAVIDLCTMGIGVLARPGAGRYVGAPIYTVLHPHQSIRPLVGR